MLCYNHIYFTNNKTARVSYNLTLYLDGGSSLQGCALFLHRGHSIGDQVADGHDLRRGDMLDDSGHDGFGGRGGGGWGAGLAGAAAGYRGAGGQQLGAGGGDRLRGGHDGQGGVTWRRSKQSMTDTISSSSRIQTNSQNQNIL